MFSKETDLKVKGQRLTNDVKEFISIVPVGAVRRPLT